MTKRLRFVDIPLAISIARYFRDGSLLREVPKKRNLSSLVVVGNGPSMNREFVQNTSHWKFVCNHFFSDQGMRSAGLSNIFHFASDPRLFSHTNIKYFQYLNEANCTSYFVPHSVFPFANNIIKGRVESFLYPSTIGRFVSGNEIVINPAFGYPTFDSVLFDFMLPFALYCRVEEIIFTGVDLSYDLNKMHFYDEEEIESERRDDEYLLKKWFNNMEYSKKVFWQEFRERNIKVSFV